LVGGAFAARLAAADGPSLVVASPDHTVAYDTLDRPGRQGATSLDGDDRPATVVEGGRDLEGEVTVEWDRELPTEIVNTVSDRTIAPDEDCLDLEDVGAHGARITHGTTVMH
jgi:hypothetical protein